jgi:hypothetical protein
VVSKITLLDIPTDRTTSVQIVHLPQYHVMITQRQMVHEMIQQTVVILAQTKNEIVPYNSYLFLTLVIHHTHAHHIICYHHQNHPPDTYRDRIYRWKSDFGKRLYSTTDR